MGTLHCFQQNENDLQLPIRSISSILSFSSDISLCYYCSSGDLSIDEIWILKASIIIILGLICIFTSSSSGYMKLDNPCSMCIYLESLIDCSFNEYVMTYFRLISTEIDLVRYSKYNTYCFLVPFV